MIELDKNWPKTLPKTDWFDCFCLRPTGCLQSLCTPGGWVLTLTRYMYMYLPFGALFGKIWYCDREGGREGDSSEMKEPKLHELGVFWVDYCKKHPIWSKLWAFLSKMVYWIDGWEIRQKIKSDFQGPAGTSTYNFDESNPLDLAPPGYAGGNNSEHLSGSNYNPISSHIKLSFSCWEKIAQSWIINPN